MTLEEATQKAFGCCIDMSKSLYVQYFWLTVRFLEDDGDEALQDYDPRDILKLIEPKVDKLIAVSPTLIK